LKISHLSIVNFRGIRTASLLLPDHAVLIGDNNTGKSTVLEALDLVLGPDRLSRPSPIDEHDFHLGVYLVKEEGSKPSKPQSGTGQGADVHAASQKAEQDGDGVAPPSPRIVITATVTGLSEEQQSYFGGHIEWWDTAKNGLYEAPDAAGLDSAPTVPALRVTFIGEYNAEEDDFDGKTYYTRSLDESDTPDGFSKRDKQRHARS
jgi:putative ATP-dependent endonuclease of OLD family